MTFVTGTALPLVLVFGVVVILLIAGRRPAIRVVPARPLVTLLSVWTGGYLVFAAAMVVYCTAQPHDAEGCIRIAVTEALVLAAITLVPATIAAIVTARRST